MRAPTHPVTHRHTPGDLLRRSAARHPERLAVACGSVRWSCRGFAALCNRVAAGLAERGVARGDRVAILARNSHAFAALRFALARLGAVLVPINCMPKGAMHTRDAVLWQLVSCVVDASISDDDFALHALPLYHCAQLDVFFGPAIYTGSRNVIAAKPTPENLLPLIERHRITSLFAPPTVWISLLRSPLFDTTDLSSLQKGCYGASIMPVAVMQEILRRLPNLRLWNLYGQTEIAPLAAMLGPDDQLRNPGSCGRAVLNGETLVVDDAMNDVPPGAVGEIVHRSPQRLAGCFHDNERTAAAFEGGWSHSGDLATVDDEGFITVVDRKKDMSKTGGENVASREVEEAIDKLAGVSEVAVVGLPHPRWVEAVVAIVVPKAGAALTEADMLAHCNAQLAGFKAPKRVVFADALPKNPGGKLLKRELRAAHQSLFGG